MPHTASKNSGTLVELVLRFSPSSRTAHGAELTEQKELALRQLKDAQQAADDKSRATEQELRDKVPNSTKFDRVWHAPCSPCHALSCSDRVAAAARGRVPSAEPRVVRGQNQSGGRAAG